MVALADARTREEYSINTSGVIVLLLMWTRASRIKTLKDKALALAVGMFQRLVRSIRYVASVMQEAFSGSARLCQPDAADGGLCPCGRDVLQYVDERADGSQWRNFVSSMNAARAACETCPCAKVAYQTIVHKLAADFDERVAGEDDGLGLTSDVRRRPRLGDDRKRRRVDEDYKQTVCIDMIRSKDAPNAGRLIKVDRVGCCVSNGRHWEADVCKMHQSASLLSFDGGRFFHVAEDGSRCGHPAEETIVYLLWEEAKKLSAVLPPQVVGVLGYPTHVNISLNRVSFDSVVGLAPFPLGSEGLDRCNPGSESTLPDHAGSGMDCVSWIGSYS